jgi:hypothetical protein
MRRYLVLGLVLVVLGMSSAVWADTSSVQLMMTYSGDTGKLTVRTIMDEMPASGCFLRYRGKVHYNGDIAARAISPLGSRQGIRSKIFERTYGKLPAIAKRGGKPAILSVQAKLYCPSGNIVSNAVARYIKCGLGQSTVTPARFLEILSVKIG